MNLQVEYIAEPLLDRARHRCLDVENVELVPNGSEYVSARSETPFLQKKRRLPKSTHESVLQRNIRIEFFRDYVFKHRDAIPAAQHISTHVVPEIPIARIATIVGSVAH